jgi:molybdopterin converting factor small subunit
VSVTVCIPPVLRGAAGGRRALESEGATLQELLVNLAREHPPLALHLFDEQAAVRRHILCIHNSNAVRPCDFASHEIRDGEEVIITNALAGG